ncbi:SMP-30/gluconolactonase/LRE family protein [Burkholderia cenocepacia]|uniref:SMP-30/gluconolactonase/LRE family protein n=1 Tax=Burkholderia TaxID=32008 RepID=UPI000F57F2CA|nr:MULTISPECIES: SMP-30/gluconolactonase/LRE family protein [Burkholderia]RQU96220.1 SMP-30/gluconolactonase/LRE family protein [Burkholderia cenocepacia]RQV33567.1 SMP-30/gluconolactonase/LRE family protein [Burkholderia cenocepacia]RQV47793.1 SMP-30/gluconolactonase/LRE family protein [Burkholderia cenocepacia]RQV83783.1 SMP-30/gluconolactonase/LRE family protein [Burkholderia cenocepacia]RQZ59968.1 SMP-30/gluconolactonase/LRE family protein [Burkholderia sp. Bp9004]
MNPLNGFTIEAAAIQTIGRDLRRPECILAQRDGSLVVADARGGIMHIDAAGEQRLVLPASAGAPVAGDGLTSGSLPNGLALDVDGNFVIANIGTDRVELLMRTGELHVLLDQIDGKPLGKVNFALRDSKNRLWITVSTRVSPWPDAIRSNLADGYIVLIDAHGPRIVADGLAFTNEIRFDATEEFLYVAETTAKRVSRFRVLTNGELGPRETYGPSQLGPGLIDGLAFDAYGNLWCAMIFADRLVAIMPTGDIHTVMDDGDKDATARFEAAFATGEVVPMSVIEETGGTIAPWITSVTFGGPDLKTVFLGSLKRESIPYFSSPVAGLPMVHW